MRELVYSIFTLTDHKDPHSKVELTAHGVFQTEQAADRRIKRNGIINAWVETSVKESTTMDIKEVAKAMQTIEFVLFSAKNGDSLRAGETEQAHKKAQEIMENYLKPLGAFITG